MANGGTAPPKRFAVIGAGIAGAFAAYFLARRGARPILIERDEVGSQASGHNAGGLNPLHGPGIPGPMSELALTSLRLHLENWDDIRRLAGHDFAGRLGPRLHVAMDEDEAAALAEREALHNHTPGFSARWLTRSELRLAAPEVSRSAVGALWTDGNARVDARPYTRAVAGAAVELGARIVRAEVHGLRSRDGRVTAVHLDRGALECDGVVIAAGPWSAAIGEWLEAPIPVSPLKGGLLLVRTARPLPAEITWSAFGAYQAGENALWLGGTEEEVGFDAAIGAATRERILAGIARLLPRLGRIDELGQVAGLRPVTPDGRPIVGIPDAWENVCVATGGGRKGMLLGAALGHAAADLLATGSTGLPVAACHPARFDLTDSRAASV